ncbi:Calca [Columba livia]|nr:Calca [Columba livia]
MGVRSGGLEGSLFVGKREGPKSGFWERLTPWKLWGFLREGFENPLDLASALVLMRISAFCRCYSLRLHISDAFQMDPQLVSGPDGVYSTVQRHWQTCAGLHCFPEY